MGGKTRNIAVQFVLPQCCKKSCVFYRTLTEILSIDCTHLWRIENIIHKYDHFQQSKILRRTKKSILQSDGVQVIISNWNWCRLKPTDIICKNMNTVFMLRQRRYHSSKKLIAGLQFFKKAFIEVLPLHDFHIIFNFSWF